MPDDPGKDLPDIAFRAAAFTVFGAQSGHRFPLVGAFIEARIRESHRKGAQPVVEMALDQSARKGAVQAAAQVGPHRYIRAQADAGGIVEQVVQLFEPAFEGALGARQPIRRHPETASRQ